MSIDCKCPGNNITETKTDVTHTIFGQEILVKNTPIYICNTCKQSEYKNPTSLYYQLKDAYRNKEYTITYSEDYDG